MVWVNLLPWRQTTLQKRWRIWRLLWIGILLLPVAGVVNGLWLNALNQRSLLTLDLWRYALREMADLKVQRLAVHDRAERLQEQLALSQRYQRQLTQWLAFTRTLEQNIPADAWLQTLEKNHLSLEMRGVGRSLGELYRLRARLHHGSLFRRVTLGDIQRADAQTMKFTLHASLASAGDNAGTHRE